MTLAATVNYFDQIIDPAPFVGRVSSAAARFWDRIPRRKTVKLIVNKKVSGQTFGRCKAPDSHNNVTACPLLIEKRQNTGQPHDLGQF